MQPLNDFIYHVREKYLPWVRVG